MPKYRRGSNVFSKSDESEIFGTHERSLQSSRERMECFKKRKAAEIKLNNSFSGPYPTDPTEFGHNDKGENAQFTHFQ